MPTSGPNVAPPLAEARTIIGGCGHVLHAFGAEKSLYMAYTYGELGSAATDGSQVLPVPTTLSPAHPAAGAATTCVRRASPRRTASVSGSPPRPSASPSASISSSAPA